jgi:hypothetical protein
MELRQPLVRTRLVHAAPDHVGIKLGQETARRIQGLMTRSAYNMWWRNLAPFASSERMPWKPPERRGLRSVGPQSIFWRDLSSGAPDSAPPLRHEHIKEFCRSGGSAVGSCDSNVDNSVSRRPPALANASKLNAASANETGVWECTTNPMAPPSSMSSTETS